MNNNLTIENAFTYRNCSVVIVLDDCEQIYQYNIFYQDSKILSGRLSDFNYKDKVYNIIDNYLDNIRAFPELRGSIKFIDHDHRIIGAFCCGRLIKIYPITPMHDLIDIYSIAVKDLQHTYKEWSKK